MPPAYESILRVRDGSDVAALRVGFVRACAYGRGTMGRFDLDFWDLGALAGFAGFVLGLVAVFV